MSKENKKLLATVIGAFKLVGYRKTNDSDYEGFILEEIMTGEKTPRSYFIGVDGIINSKTHEPLVRKR